MSLTFTRTCTNRLPARRHGGLHPRDLGDRRLVRGADAIEIRTARRVQVEVDAAQRHE